MHRVSVERGEFDFALQYYKAHILYNDSIQSEEIQSQALKKEMKYKFEKRTTTKRKGKRAASSLPFLAATETKK